MDESAEGIMYEDLGDLADNILEDCDEDVARLAERIERMPPEIRNALLASDFLNAYQVFYFFFRVEPEELEMEKLLLIPASELQYGMLLNEIECNELIFAVIRNEPVMIVSDGDQVLASYTGTIAYRKAIEYIKPVL